MASRAESPTWELPPGGLSPSGYLIPWIEWKAGEIVVRQETCHVERDSPVGKVHLVVVRIHLTNLGNAEHRFSLFAVLAPLGPAGGAVNSLTCEQNTLLMDNHPVLLALPAPVEGGVVGLDESHQLATQGKLPDTQGATSEAGNCSGAVRFDLILPAGTTVDCGLICPVLTGRQAVGHDWDGESEWAQFDLAEPNPARGGVPQPDPGLGYYRKLSVDGVFAEAEEFWNRFADRFSVDVPDPRWGVVLKAILGHAAMAMNEGAPDVAVINYNVFNRDGVYTTSILQKSGLHKLAAAAIDYFLTHPFNGRTEVEADNPGQVAWIMGEHWLFSRDRSWLERVYPKARKLAELIRYYRTAKGPHYVKATSLDFGDNLPPD